MAGLLTGMVQASVPAKMFEVGSLLRASGFLLVGLAALIYGYMQLEQLIQQNDRQKRKDRRFEAWNDRQEWLEKRRNRKD